MAKCEQGYLCSVCGGDVENITESDLYLRYVIGQIHPEQLHVSPERHIRCNPALAQFITAPDFPPIFAAGPFDKRLLDPEFVRQQEILVTRGFQRLQEIISPALPIIEYPLPEVIARWKSQSEPQK
jgi:hypothetical protein